MADEVKKVKDEEEQVVTDATVAETRTAGQENSTETKGESEKAVEKKPDEGNDEKMKSNDEKQFTQSQVNEIAGKARADGRASALKELYARYGVNDEKEFDGILGKGKTYDELNEAYSTQGATVKEVQAENALLKTKIEPSRWEDVKLILTGKGLDVTAENISGLLDTHPEWLGKTEEKKSDVETPKPTSKISKLGAEISEENPDEKNKLDRLFGLSK